MREIGSEFWDVPTTDTPNGVFSADTVWYLSGRIALSAIIDDILRTRKIDRVLLPSWCCDSMIVPFLSVGAKVEFYGVTLENGRPVTAYPEHIDADVILLMDYFGYTKPNVDLNRGNCVVIRDVTHSVFSCYHSDADYYFGSLRKWAGFYTGGFARKSNGVLPAPDKRHERYIALRKNAMAEKRRYIDGLTDSKEYLKTFSAAEAELDKLSGSYAADNTDTVRANFADVRSIREKRRSNAKILISELSKFSLFDLRDGDCPLFVPISVSNRDKVKSALIENSVYCPCHWGLTSYHKLSDSEKRIYESEISLVCDQRYGAAEMLRICDIVKKAAV